MFSKTLAIFAGFACFFLLGEFFLRITQANGFEFKNYIRARFRFAEEEKPFVIYDPLVGWINLKNRTVISYKLDPRAYHTESRGFKISIDSFGHRQVPSIIDSASQKKRPPIFAIGDSFTFGGEVSDEETWPTYLQALSKTPVINLAVQGFGLDQIYLFLNKYLLVPPHFKEKSKILILSLTPENLRRVSRTNKVSSPTGFPMPKPYYELVDGELNLRQIPATPPRYPTSLGLVREVLGYSTLIDLLFVKYFKSWWFAVQTLNSFPKQFTTEVDPAKLSCLILAELKASLKTRQFKVILLSQDYYQEMKNGYQSVPEVRKVIDCAERLAIDVIDTGPALEEIFKRNFQEYQTLFIDGGHMTNRGNLLTAKLIYNFLKNKLP